ncbi:uncharacterized protein LOC106167402 [Lingula anatina]|uniref:Uncharacterized protein LOC106167402 n=1 Tax=Lingula anatina TaxID=7574 RepID=A0A1S3IUN7_LINAN|nr:uncharacterized protein LOC106167402 [Lingula anatina]|eukprot:XP_013401646.1 uncharacterized protein LOC106167402 [Lingula anatina]
MAAQTVYNTNQLKYPYWTNVPPNVPKYPMPPDMFRREVPEKYTRPLGRQSYQNWQDKWYDNGFPLSRDVKEELRKVDPREPGQRPWMYQPGTCNLRRWSRSGADWPMSEKDYFFNGCTEGEATRARGMNRIWTTTHEPNLYPYSNFMTSTYRKPVYSIYGHLQRRPVYGVTHQHNRHGNMPFEDYY